jgi:hypothetical protein
VKNSVWHTGHFLGLAIFTGFFGLSRSLSARFFALFAFTVA